MSDPQGPAGAADEAGQLAVAAPHPLATLNAERAVEDCVLNTGSPEVERSREFHNE
jgi:hypothetical protein